MSIRHVVRTVAVSGAAVLCGAVFLLAIDSGVAGASLTNGFTTLNTSGSVAPNTPYASGQVISVSVAGSSTPETCPGSNPPVTTASSNPLSTSYQMNCGSAPAPTGGYSMEMCEDPGGSPGNLPTNFTGCEQATLVTVGGTPSTGAIAASSYTVYLLPDGNIEPSGPSMTAAPGACGTYPDYCVIGIFNGDPNSGNPGFGRPHIFSAPFLVNDTSNGADDGTINPGDGTPEVPLAIGLPLAALSVFGAVMVRNRRRQRRMA